MTHFNTGFRIADQIAHAIRARQLKQEDAAAGLGIDPSGITSIMQGQFRGTSGAKLLELVAKLSQDV